MTSFAFCCIIAVWHVKVNEFIVKFMKIMIIQMYIEIWYGKSQLIKI